MAPGKKKAAQEAPSPALKMRPITAYMKPSPKKKLEVLEAETVASSSTETILKPPAKKQKIRVIMEGEENKKFSNKTVSKKPSKASSSQVKKDLGQLEEETTTTSGGLVASSKAKPSSNLKAKRTSASNDGCDSKKKQAAVRQKKATAMAMTLSNHVAAANPPPAPFPSSSAPAAQASFPRISKKQTLSELRHEAVCRGLAQKSLPKLKSDILNFLGDGSIHLSQTTAWKKVEEIKNRIQAEQAELCEKKRLEERKAEEQREVKRQKEVEQERARRIAEIESQRSLHRHSFPRVHPHPLAKTETLTLKGRERCTVCICSICDTYRNNCIWTCEACDFDVCELCFQLENRSDEEKARARDAARREALKQQKREQEMRKEWNRKQEEEERQYKLRWDETKQFDKLIRDPPEKNKSPGGCGMKGFTVWCSEGYDLNEASTFFDTTWKTAEEANQRARYLFYWKNCWGLDPDDLYS